MACEARPCVTYHHKRSPHPNRLLHPLPRSAVGARTLECLHAACVCPGVRTWQGDIVDLPDHLGWGADAVFFNGCFGNMHDPRAALLRCTLMMRPGAYIVISHPMGETWHRGLAKQQPHLTPHLLPGSEGLKEMLKGLPLSVVQCVDEPNLYITVLQVRYGFIVFT